MPNSMTRTHPTDRFYCPPAMRWHRRYSQLQEQYQRESQPDPALTETPYYSDDSTLSTINSLGLPSPPRSSNLTNLDRVMEAVTPFVPVHYLTEARIQGWRTREADRQPYFCLRELWESFYEWSVCGVGVPLLLNGSDTLKQYYVPSLSGIQLYVDQQSSRSRHGEDNEAESLRDASSANSSGCEAETHVKVDQRGLGAMKKSPNSSSGDEKEIYNSNGFLAFEYLEKEQPRARKPLYDKVSSLASQFPDIKIYRSCDLLPTSWVAVAWYPIYRIPTGPTLQNVDASFLTFHALSTNGKNHMIFDEESGRKPYVGAASSRVPLPVFGLASYKLRGSILSPSGSLESQKAKSLLRVADNWLQRLEVNLPDFQFFVSHNLQWR
ncbi:hypothetical protein K2173_010211 [Erythroxylum novogranatense]|uniref:Uncharacterized protein n=1 Tax=Erythroxylum novogranatense TaxID=1862640 RepID=A0AAV8U9F0_9ROSI|nr:hypothetical protein K2173_010211 [Erythroxylum novogranatense]